VAALALGSGQLDSISGTQESRRVERRHAPDMERPSRSGRSRGSATAELRAGGPPEA
jgi:hypothetical protein